MLSDIIPQTLRKLLFPFSFLYWMAVVMRNWLYDKKILKSSDFALPIIGVGNLAVGGTGKSPMTEYLVRLLKDEYKLAILSRGYKRRTKGYALADANSSALDIGDEPMQFHLKFPEVAVAVGEERLVAVAQLLHDRPDTQVIVMDDVFQHRAIIPGLNILLTDYSNLFTKDFYLPAGELRDQKSSAKRADIIVVTKSPANLSGEKARKVRADIAPAPQQSLYFSTMEYGSLYHLFTNEPANFHPDADVIILSGIANPAPFKAMISERVKKIHFLHFADHHIFNQDDMKALRKKLEAIKNPQKLIVTTEKDAVRLFKFKEKISEWPIYALPVRHHFLFNETDQFNNQVKDFIRGFDTTIKN